jgi:hypothetical protein
MNIMREMLRMEARKTSAMMLMDAPTAWPSSMPVMDTQMVILG